MKKLTLILSMMLALVGIHANAAMYIVGSNPFGNWDPSKGVEMTLQNDGTYTLDATLVQNDIWFIFAEAIGDWNTVNANRYDSGNPASDLTVYAGVEFTPVKGATDKSFFFSGTAGETYTFSFNPTTGKAMVASVAPFSPLTGKLFILGQVNGNNWNPSTGIELATTDENTFTLTGAEITDSGDGFGFFSFTSKLGEASDDWSFTSYRRGAQADGTLVEDGVEAVLADWGSTGAFKVLPGTYDIEVNLSDNYVVLTQETPEPVYDDVYVFGDVNNFSTAEGWDPTKGTQMELVFPKAFEGVTYELDVNATPREGQELAYIGLTKKLADPESETPWDDIAPYRFGPVSNGDFVMTEDLLGVECDLATDGSYNSIALPEGTWSFCLDLENHKFIIFGTWPTDTVEPEPTFTVFTVAGPEAVFGTDWDATNTNNDMTLNAQTGLYTWMADSVALTGNFGFKVVGNHNWDYSWPEGYDNNWIVNIAEEGMYNLVITFNAETKEINCVATKVNAEEPPVVEITSYTVVGPEAVFGTDWDVNDTNNDMVLDPETGLYTWTADSVALTGNFGFKVVGNHDYAVYENPMGYDNNWIVNIAEEGLYNLVITLNAETHEINCVATKVNAEEPPVVEITSYTVVGPEAVFGTDWDVNDTNNDMVLDPETGLYTWTADSVALTGNFGFKVVGNHDYAVYENPMGYDNNWIVNIAEEGLYNLVITLNTETNEINCVATKVNAEEPPVEMVYTVVGPQAIFGTEWDETDTNNDMTLADGVYTWTKQNVELAAGSFGFKVVGNHNWDNEWPIGYDNNWIANVEEAGIYTIVITYNPEAEDADKITCTLTKTGDIEPVHYDGDVYILGEVNDNGGWFTNKGVKMTRDAENYLYTATITTTGEAFIDPETNIGYSYFSFTKQLADSAADWDAIAPYRFGAVSEGNFWVTDETLGTTIALTNNGATFQIPAGEWNLTLSVDDMTLVIEKAEQTFLRGDVDNNGEVKIADVTALINYLLSGDASAVNLQAADCDQNGEIKIADVTALINYLLSGQWND